MKAFVRAILLGSAALTACAHRPTSNGLSDAAASGTSGASSSESAGIGGFDRAGQAAAGSAIVSAAGSTALLPPPPSAAGAMAMALPSQAGAVAMPSAGATATSTAGATAMSVPAAGAAALQPALDPAVKFEWEETAPGTHKDDNCQAGVYTGMSLCVFTPANGSAGAPAMPMAGGLQVSAVISIELEKSADGEFLEISGGDFASISFGLFGLRAQLKGSLDCKDLHLTAKTQNGIWALGDPATSPSPGMFDAEFDGTLDPAQGTLAGQWDIYGGLSNTPIGSCAGTWSTNRSP